MGFFKRKITAASAAQPMNAEHLGDAYPGNKDTGDPVARERAVTRLLGVLLVASLGLNVVMGAAVSVLVPNYRVELALLTLQPESKMVVEVQPLRMGRPGMEIYLNGQVREWILKRHQVVPNDTFMTQQVLWVFNRSSDDVRREYERSSRNFVRQAVDRGITRTIPEDRIAVTSQGNGFYVVDFEAVDTADDGVGEARQNGAPRVIKQYRWRVEMQVGLQPQRIQNAEFNNYKLVNPFGFTVMSYSRTDTGGGDSNR